MMYFCVFSIRYVYLKFVYFVRTFISICVRYSLSLPHTHTRSCMNSLRRVISLTRTWRVLLLARGRQAGQTRAHLRYPEYRISPRFSLPPHPPPLQRRACTQEQEVSIRIK